MHGVLLSGCAGRGWTRPGLSAQLGQMDPHSFTTVNTACFMSPAVLIFCTLFNPSPYNIHFSRTRSHSEKLFLEQASCSCFMET